MPEIVCAACDEAEDLVGSRGPAGIEITCQRCGHAWLRDSAPTCKLCGSTALVPTKQPLWAKGRGDQHTPAGTIVGYACNSCGGRNVTSSKPVAASPSDELEERW